MFLINVTDSITLTQTLISLGVATIIGAVFGAFYSYSKRKEGIDRSFVITLILLPAIVAMFIMLVSNDIVKIFSLGGVFTLVRFRTRIKDVKDALYLFCIVCIGFACGLEYYLFAAIIALFILLVLTIIDIIKLDQPCIKTYRLKILIPESLDYINLFDQIFEKYLKSATLKKVKTTDFGSLIELTYIIKMNDISEQKKFIDELRRKNGNLNIVLADDYERLLNLE